MENRTFDIPRFLTSIPSLVLRTIFEFLDYPPRNIDHFELFKVDHFASNNSKILFLRHVITNSKSQRIARRMCSSIRIIEGFFVTLFVINYKVASLEIIRGSRIFLFFLVDRRNAYLSERKLIE